MDMKMFAMAFGLAAATSFAAQYEAETATLDNSKAEAGQEAAVANDANASGGKIVKLNGGNLVFENVEASAAGNHTVTIHYKNNYEGEKTNNIGAGTSSSPVKFPETETGKYGDVTAVVKLAAGSNKITITKSWGWIDVDYISVEPYVAEPITFTLCNAPATAEATPSAVKLYNFLVNNFGKKTISGVMTGNMDNYTMGDFSKHEDVQVVLNTSGKLPVLVGIDLLNATGAGSDGTWGKGYTEKAMDIAKDLWKKGGIPAITWHWRPGEESAFYTKSGNANEYTEFDFTNAFVKGTTSWDTLSTEYKAIVGDLDKVSALFKDLQDAGVAAIFRPLHESGGKWFWWGTHTGKQFAALYQLVYERIAITNGIKNLIWDFNPQDGSTLTWTPGEDYYDVLSIDIYNNAFDNQSNFAAFNEFAEKGGVNKVIALSENGPIPDVKESFADGAYWSWWMPWYDSWGDASHKYISQTSKEVWTSNMADERIITLDEMPGWDSYTEANAGTKTCPTATAKATFGADTAKASQELVSYAMGLTLKLDSTILINSTKLNGISSTNKISMEITNMGEGGEAEDGGVWIGLAFVRNGMDDEQWTWEMSTDTTCWISAGTKSTCEFEIENYLSGGELVPMDKNNLFSMNIMIGGNKGFSGVVLIDNIMTEEGKLINGFDKKSDLFAKSEKTDTQISKIELLNEDGTASIKRVAAVRGSKMQVAGNQVMLSTSMNASVSVEVFSMTGKRVATLHKGYLSAGEHSFGFSAAKGVYFVRAFGQGINQIQKVMVK